MALPLAINAAAPLLNIGASGAINPASDLVASNLSLLTAGLVGGGSAIVELSGLGQLLSAAATFQDQLGALVPGTAGGQNPAPGVASLAAKAQSLVDAFNGLQSNIANINGVGDLLGASVPASSGLVPALDALAQSVFSNGDSSLTRLSQIGITFEPGGGLSLDVSSLEAAFASDASGAFSLLNLAANAFGDVAKNFVSQTGPQFSVLNALSQASVADQFLSGNLSFSGLPNGGFNLADLLARESLTSANSANANAPSVQQVVLALTEFSLVSNLLS